MIRVRLETKPKRGPGDRHSTVVLSAPTILQPWSSNPNLTIYAFSIYNVEIETVFDAKMRKGRKQNKKRPGLAHVKKPKRGPVLIVNRY